MISNKLSISAYMHCGMCLRELPKGMSPREFGAVEVGFTDIGIQVWCKRHEINVMHVDFQGHQHPADLTARVEADASGLKALFDAVPPVGPIDEEAGR